MRTLTVPEFLTDQELVATVQQLVNNDRSNLVGLLVHLGELDERKLYLEAAKPSLFAYCVEVLRMSEGTTFKRIAAARAARRFPIILEMITTGEMHLSGLTLLAKHLTETNHLDVLARGRNKSKRELEKLTAQLCPQPDTASRIQKLALPKRSELPENTSESPHLPKSSEAVQGEVVSQQSGPTPQRPSSDSRVTATAPERYRVKFTADEAFANNLREAQALLKSQIPDGDIAQIMDRALRVLLVEVKKKKLGASGGRRRTSISEEGRRSHEPPPPPEVERGERPSRSRTIPVAVRRAVYDRDGGRCTFTNKQGTRCTADCGLEFHHEVPFGVGGEHRVENIRLLCKPHNLAQARQDYGAERIEQRLLERRPPERTVAPITFPGEGATASRSRGSRQRLTP